MIGLGSNRLTVCRRGGMSVTQAGRGGMEWLAGGRMPSWSSPYSAQASAALKAAYPDLWNTLVQFGFDNPDKVPFINQYPLVAPYLLADGLAFMVDCQYECSAATWKDIIGEKIFTGSGVSLQSGVPYFNGSARYTLGEILNFSNTTTTIEVVFVCDDFTFPQAVFSIDKVPSISLLFNQNNKVFAGVNSRTYPNSFWNSNISQGVLAAISANNDRAYQNKVTLTLDARDWQTGSNYTTNTCIGYWRNATREWLFKGKIYAIRIYNRLLTEQEILANQAIDLQRWQPS